MKALLNLSLRHKVPIWGAVLIIATAVAVSASLIKGEYEELQEDLAIDAAILGDSVRTSLTAALLQDDTWAAFATVSAPMSIHHPRDENPIHPNDIFVIDRSMRVLVSASPEKLPLDTDLSRASPSYASLAARIRLSDGQRDEVIELPGSDAVYFVSPIMHRNEVLGSLVISYPNQDIASRFHKIVWRGTFAAGLILAMLLPINWYVGQRMARPLVELANRMEQVGREGSHELELAPYPHRDELGRLFDVYNDMLRQLKRKEMLEVEMLRSERLSAVGRLAAGVAHEINNPLSGMLTALDTLRHHGDVSPIAMKTLGLVERGLNQIKDIVAALLVQAKMKGRNLTPEDVEDVHTLMKPQARRKRLRIEWNNRLPSEVPLPATLVRQVLINLLLNAVQAAAEESDISMDIAVGDDKLSLSVANNGKPLDADERAHIFEPFSPVSQEGHGLGLWVTYQIVKQLNGEIGVTSIGDRTIFSLTTPIKGVA